MLADRIKKHLPLFTFFLILLGYFVYLGPLVQSDGVWVNDEGNRMLHIDAFAWHDGCIPDPMNGVMVPGLSPFAPGMYFVREQETKKIISGYTPAFPFLESFLYRIGGYPLCRLSVLLFAWVCICLTGWILSLSGAGPVRTSLGMCLIGLCTPLFFYSGILLELTLIAMLCSGVFLLIRQALTRENLWFWGAAGLVCSLIPWFREEGYVLSLALLIAIVFFQWKRYKVWCAFGIPCLLGIFALLTFNYMRTGAVFGLHHLIYEQIRTEPKTVGSILKSVWFFLYQPNMHNVMTSLCGGLFVFCTVFGFIPDRIRGIPVVRTILFYLLAAAALLNTACFFCMPDPVENMVQYQSLAATAPFVFIPLLFFQRFLKDGDTFRKILFFTGFLTLTGISLNLEYCNRGLFFGPRHYLLILPLFAILTLYSADYMKSGLKWVRPAFIVLCLFSLFCQFYGVRLLNLRKEFSTSLITICRMSRTPLIITDVFFVPEELAVLHEKPPVLFVTDEGIRILSAVLDHNHANSFLFLTSERFSSAPSFQAVFSERWELTPLYRVTKPDLKFMTLFVYACNRKPENGK